MHTSDNMPRISPLIRPTRPSLNTSSNFCLAVRSSSMRTRIVTASDCVPTFPAISSISDWKHITIVSWATTVSNIPTTDETTSPRPRSIISHGRRFLILCFSGSCKSSSEVRPASMA